MEPLANTEKLDEHLKEVVQALHGAGIGDLHGVCAYRAACQCWDKKTSSKATLPFAEAFFKGDTLVIFWFVSPSG
ncbi:MAG: hypothetical protein ACREQV_19765 [Candidatus Binatia bacterium]